MHGLVKDFYKRLFKRYIVQRACRIEKRRKREERFLLQNQKKGGNNRMLREIESLTAFNPQICHIGRFPNRHR